MEKCMAITEREFISLRPKEDKILDGRGRQWHVHSNRANTGCDVAGPRVVGLSLEREIQVEQFGYFNGSIIDQDWGKDIDLNHPDARIISG